VKRTAWVSLIVLGLALVGPAAAYAHSKTPKYAHPEVSKQSQKQAKSYNKELNKAQKHQNKMQKKQMKAWQKQHPESHSVTGRG
jgi:ribulose kinase